MDVYWLEFAWSSCIARGLASAWAFKWMIFGKASFTATIVFILVRYLTCAGPFSGWLSSNSSRYSYSSAVLLEPEPAGATPVLAELFLGYIDLEELVLGSESKSSAFSGSAWDNSLAESFKRAEELISTFGRISSEGWGNGILSSIAMLGLDCCCRPLLDTN